MNLHEISEIEHRLVSEAPRKYGQVFQNTAGVIAAMSRVVSSVDQASAMTFGHLYPQTVHSLSLSLLSVVRLHETQAMLMLRQALEYGVLAVYSLGKGSYDFYGRQVPDGSYQINQKALDTAYSWLSTVQVDASEKIKSLKIGYINQLYAHANLPQSTRNVSIAEGHVEFSPFDKQDTFEALHLWKLGDVAGGLVTLAYEINDRQENAAVVFDAGELEQLGSLLTTQAQIGKDLLARFPLGKEHD